MPLNQNDRVSVGTPSIAVFGLGFVGLPLALSFAMKGCKIIGVDVLDSLVTDLNRGITHHQEHCKGVSIREILIGQLSQGNFRATTDAEGALCDATGIIITVGIPVRGEEVILEPLQAVCRTVASGLKRGDTVILRSTVVPGTTEEMVLPILETSGLKAGSDFYLAYASERVAEGRAFEEFESVPCLVAGVNPESTDRAMSILAHVTRASLVPGSSIKAVEITKVIENVQRDVNIAMVQEFARFTEAMGVDIFEVVRLANTHPRVRLLEPGPGVGGYCIPNALHYLLPKGSELGVSLDLAVTARRINDNVPEFVVSLVENAVTSVASNTVSTIGVLGLAMKDYSNDDRLSPATRVVDLLLRKGYRVKAYDPVVPTQYAYKVSSLEECCEAADCVLILAKQHGVTGEALISAVEKSKPGCTIVDTRNVISPNQHFANGHRVIRI